MGKTTLYHPVSLHVIRGAAEYCGFQFGTIKQKWSDREKQTARYDVEIVKMPGDLMETGTLLGIHHDLQNCFMDDIRVHWVHMTQSGTWACQLAVGIPAGDAGLIPNPEPSIEPLPSPRGGGGGGEPDKIFATISDEGYAVCHFCKNKLFWATVYKYSEGESLQLVGQSGLECRGCWSLYDMNFMLLQGPMQPEDDYGDDE